MTSSSSPAGVRRACRRSCATTSTCSPRAALDAPGGHGRAAGWYVPAARRRLSTVAGELAVVPAGRPLRGELQRDALGRLGAQPRPRSRAVTVAAAVAGRAARAPSAGDDLDVAVDLGPRLDHHAAQLVVLSPSSICSVARGSRSRLRTFWDLAYVQAQISPSRTTYQSGIRCGQPREAVGRADHDPLLARGSAACSSAVSLICVAPAHGRALSARSSSRPPAIASAAARTAARASLGLEHDRVAGLLERLAHEPVDAGEAELDDHRAVLELGDDVALLARPARALGRDPHPSAARGGHLAGPRPAVDVGRRVDVGPRLECSAVGGRPT